MTAASSIRQANRGDYDFYLALHSNASGPGSQGQNRGVIAFYYPTSANGRRGAEIIARNMQEIYPLPERVVTRPTTTLGEVRQPRAPAVLVEIGYHDNEADARWIESHIDAIGQNLAMSMAEYFGLPFTYPGPSQPGVIVTESGGPGADPDPQWGDGDGVRAVSGMVRGAVRRYPGVRQRAICANLDI